MADLLIALAWIAIILTPAIVAYLQPVVSADGYLDLSRKDKPNTLQPARVRAPRR